MNSVKINRLISWFFAVGYVAVHYLWPLRHGEGDLMSMDPIPRAFFMVSFVWMTGHAVFAWKLYGWPTFKLKSLRDLYILDAWLVLLVTTPIFSVPSLGANRFLMAMAWPPLAIHLALNAWFMGGRLPIVALRGKAFRSLLVIAWLAWVAGAAVRSFPH